jgi:hypothetical protein
MLLLTFCGLLGGRGCDVGWEEVVALVAVWFMAELLLSLSSYLVLAFRQQLV